jgi:hypothetical protein
MIASDEILDECEEKLLEEIAHQIYDKDTNRAEILIDAVDEYYTKIKTDNDLNFEHLIMLVERETKTTKRFSDKIDIELLSKFSKCLTHEDDIIFHQRIIEFLEALKREYGTTHQ